MLEPRSSSLWKPGATQVPSSSALTARGLCWGLRECCRQKPLAWLWRPEGKVLRLKALTKESTAAACSHSQGFSPPLP